MDYILGLDLGETSLGWCVVREENGEPAGIENMGVRIFPDGRDAKKHEPLAVARRTARGMRRRHDRYLKRRERLMDCLIANGFMPQNQTERKALEKLDPYELRAKALDEKLPPFSLGRVLFHINQRRGFQSNRKTDKKQTDAGAMKTAIEKTRVKIAASGARTLGEFLYRVNKDKKSTQTYEPVRMKSTVDKGKSAYDMYADRDMYKDEVRQIFAAQGLSETDGAGKRIFDIIFFQRPLKQPELGKCRFEEWEDRAYKASPTFQKIRVLQEINQLRVGDDFDDRPLTADEKMSLATYALTDFSKTDKKKTLLTWAAVRKILNLNAKTRFNLDSEKRKGIDVDTTAVVLSGDDCFGKKWFDFSDDEKDAIVSLISDEDDEDVLVGKLSADYGLAEQNARAAANVPLEDGVASLSLKAMKKIMPFLQKGDLYNEAVVHAGYQFSMKVKDRLPDRYDGFINPANGEVFDELPYYGEVFDGKMLGATHDAADKKNPEKYFGKINNPTVHIALNQLRTLVNALVERYGHPDKIVVELARELKLSKKQRAEMEKEQAANQKDNERIAGELEKLGVKNTYANRMKYKVWEDLAKDPVQRCCPYCGRQISAGELFSPNFETEHVLPFAQSYSDSRLNQVVSCRACNREKGNRSPWDAFHDDAKRWNEILARVENMPDKSKRWRFTQEAAESVRDSKPLDRMLTDTQYMSRVAREYLCWAANPNKVTGVPGTLTAKLRHHWGLDEIVSKDGKKDRTEHRHHAIDAFVVACTNRGVVQRYATQRGDAADVTPDEKTPHVPFPSFCFADAQKAFDAIVVSYKPDTGDAAGAVKRGQTVSALHEETYYGDAGAGEKGMTRLVKRIPVEQVSAKNLDDLADQSGTAAPIRVELEGRDEKEHAEIIKNYFANRGTKKVRVFTEKNPDSLVWFKDKSGKKYRCAVSGNNAYAEIYMPDRGKNAGKWQMEIVSQYDAHQKGFLPKWRHTDAHAKLIMRLHINDMVAYEKNGETVIAKVKKMSGKRIYLRPHVIAKEDADTLSWGAFASSMQEGNLRKIKVDVTGRVFDPKKPKREKTDGQAG